MTPETRRFAGTHGGRDSGAGTRTMADQQPTIYLAEDEAKWINEKEAEFDSRSAVVRTCVRAVMENTDLLEAHR